ncbi:MAG: PaaI family thioesterase [Porticoccaceae bacterium]|nr:PaaI family thioesterase [Porticoccaceae bacterium]
MIESPASLQTKIADARALRNPQLLLDFIPYAAFIGAKAEVKGSGIIYRLDKRPSNIGNPSLPAIHGGVIGGFLELSASVEILYTAKVQALPRVVDFSIDYLRPGRYKAIYASCEVLRQGRKLINVSALAWQDDQSTPIATARCHFLIS